MAEFSRSIDKCNQLYEGKLVSDDERNAMRALPAFSQFQAISLSLRDATNFDNEQSKTALSKAVSGPMFGVLESLMYNKVDYSELEKSFTPDQAFALPILVSALVLCRMGDDCGRDGIVTEQLCWQNGLCGDNAQDAILANFHARGVDPTALNHFVTKVNQSLQTGDTSIFRKK